MLYKTNRILVMQTVKNSKKITAACIVLLLFEMTLIPAIGGNKTIDVKMLFKNESKVPVIYIDVSSPYEYGYEAGKRFRSQYELIIDLFARSAKNTTPNKKNVENQINDMKQFCPLLLEELSGLSVSLGIGLDKLLLLQKFTRSLALGECTTTLSTGKATKNNEKFLTQDFDIPKDSVKNRLLFFITHIITLKCWVAKINTMKYKYAFWGIPIICEIPFLNEKGLGFGGNAMIITENKSRYIDEGPGMSAYMLERLTMMTCKNVSEVATLWKNTERASGTDRSWPHFWDNGISVWCDKEGGILVIEQTHNHIITVFRNSTEITGAPEDILWHANHHQWLDPNQTGSIYPSEYISSYFREKRARELLEANYGNITLDFCKKLTRGHGGGTNPDGKDSSDICCHSDKNSSVATAFAWIIQPKNLTVYWTHGTPCLSRFVRYDFTKIFGIKN
jgi:hypothetical protein